MATNFSKYGNVVSFQEAGIEQTEDKSFLRKAGEFLAPTATGIVTGEKDISVKTLLGAGLEIGSFFIPAGAGVRGVLALRRAKPIVGSLLQKTKGVFSRLRGQTGAAAKVGGISGAAFGAGRELGEEDSTLQSVAGQAALTGTIAAGAGAVLAPVVSLATMTAKGITGITARGIRQVNRTLKPESKEIAINSLAEGYQKSFVADKSSINNSLDKIAKISSRTGGPKSKEGLLKEIAELGYVPTIEGKLANMRPVIDDLGRMRKEMVDWIDSFIKPVKEKISISQLKKRVNISIKDDFGIDVVKTQKQVDSIFKSLQEKFGAKLSASQVNQIRVEMNKLTKSFQKEQFIQDTQNAIARVTRNVIDELVPTGIVRDINKEMSKLFRVEDVARVFHNKPIDAGFMGEAMGRFLGTAGGATLGLSIAGPGGLVIAGVLANMGSRAVASMIRKARFNPKIIEAIRQGVANQQDIIKRLISNASKEDAAVLRQLLK